MKSFFFFLIALLMVILPLSGQSRNAKSRNINLKFTESDSVFTNPGQGWMSSRLPSVIRYVRVNWADLEPERGKYDWSVFDKAIEAGKAKGVKISIRVMTCNAHSRGYYSSPKWLFDEGCKGIEYLRGGDDPTSGGERIPRIEPVYSDPIYLQRHDEFIKAMGKRYNGTPDVEFLDIGSYGIWGEWHTPNAAPVEVRKKIVDMYINAFPDTPLVFMSDDAEVLPYALEHGTGMRRDGVGSRWHENTWIGSKKYAHVTAMADAWKQAPVVFEWFGDYEYLQRRGWSYDSAVNFMLNNHVTVINDNVGRVPAEKMPRLYELAKLAGARFVLRELEHASSVKTGSPLNIRMKWENTGVGKLYQPYVLRLWLLDPSGKPVISSDAGSDPVTWLPGSYDLNESIKAPSKKGKYMLALGFADKTGQRAPFRIANDLPYKEGMYIISEVQVK